MLHPKIVKKSLCNTETVITVSDEKVLSKRKVGNFPLYNFSSDILIIVFFSLPDEISGVV